MTRAAALALYRKACASHKRADWRMACHALAALVEIAEKPSRPPVAAPEPRTRSLLEFLADRGIRDDGRELSARDADLWHKRRPFQRRLVRPDGVSLEHAAEMAWEAGYFPDVPIPRMDSADNMHAVTPDMLLEAIERELRREMEPPATDDDYWSSLEDFEMQSAA
jgi:hypothetical protein